MAEFEDKIYELIKTFSEQQVDVETLIATACHEHIAQHRGEVRRALRILMGEGRVVYSPIGDIVKIN